MLRSQVEESEFWIYERGPVAEELRALRESRVAQAQEIDRLTSENARVMRDLRRAEAIVSDAGRRHARHEPGHPHDVRASITQTFVNDLFQRSRRAGQQNKDPQA